MPEHIGLRVRKGKITGLHGWEGSPSRVAEQGFSGQTSSKTAATRGIPGFPDLLPHDIVPSSDCIRATCRLGLNLNARERC